HISTFSLSYAPLADVPLVSHVPLLVRPLLSMFFFNNLSPPELSSLSLHDALPICARLPILPAADPAASLHLRAGLQRVLHRCGEEAWPAHRRRSRHLALVPVSSVGARGVRSAMNSPALFPRFLHLSLTTLSFTPCP